MLINAKINDTAQKMMWAEAINTCKHIRKIMATTGSTISPFEKLNGENPRSLVRSWSSDVSDTSLNGKFSRIK